MLFFSVPIRTVDFLGTPRAGVYTRLPRGSLRHPTRYRSRRKSVGDARGVPLDVRILTGAGVDVDRDARLAVPGLGEIVDAAPVVIMRCSLVLSEASKHSADARHPVRVRVRVIGPRAPVAARRGETRRLHSSTLHQQFCSPHEFVAGFQFWQKLFGSNSSSVRSLARLRRAEIEDALAGRLPWARVERPSKTFKPEICAAKPSRASSLLMRHVASAAPTSSAEATAHALVYAVPREAVALLVGIRGCRPS